MKILILYNCSFDVESSSAPDVTFWGRVGFFLLFWCGGIFCLFWLIAAESIFEILWLFKRIFTFNQLFERRFLYLLIIISPKEIVYINLWDILRRRKQKWILNWIIKRWRDWSWIVLNQIWSLLQSIILQAELRVRVVAKRDILRQVHRVFPSAESGCSRFFIVFFRVLLSLGEGIRFILLTEL